VFAFGWRSTSSRDQRNVGFQDFVQEECGEDLAFTTARQPELPISRRWTNPLPSGCKLDNSIPYFNSNTYKVVAAVFATPPLVGFTHVPFFFVFNQPQHWIWEWKLKQYYLLGSHTLGCRWTVEISFIWHCQSAVHLHPTKNSKE
jgi:hypothetical protein